MLVDRIEQCIYLIRREKVILDADLAVLYGTTTKAFNQAIKRNLRRFPADFMFQLTAEEAQVMRSRIAIANLRSQIVTSSFPLHGGRRYLPYAFTEHGALMAASILNTPRAIDVSVYVIRAFVKLRELLSTHKELAYKLVELERKVSCHDESIQSLVSTIRRLMQPPIAPKRPQIGFHTNQKEK
ncbi:MAG: ORF6N domain-containing protein [Thermoguttaceae bacterium]